MKAIDKDLECPSCGRIFNTSELDYDEEKMQLLCPEDGAVIVEGYHEPKE